MSAMSDDPQKLRPMLDDQYIPNLDPQFESIFGNKFLGKNQMIVLIDGNNVLAQMGITVFKRDYEGEDKLVHMIPQARHVLENIILPIDEEYRNKFQIFYIIFFKPHGPIRNIQYAMTDFFENSILKQCKRCYLSFITFEVPTYRPPREPHSLSGIDDRILLEYIFQLRMNHKMAKLHDPNILVVSDDKFVQDIDDLFVNPNGVPENAVENLVGINFIKEFNHNFKKSIRYYKDLKQYLRSLFGGNIKQDPLSKYLQLPRHHQYGGSDDRYYHKYLKYKTKYLDLKKSKYLFSFK